MRLIHLADLHLGKTIYGVSLLENGDQPFWVSKFLSLAEEKRPDAVLIAGDLYDHSSPSGQAVELFSRLVTGLADMDIPVMMVAGNHDSGQRISFAGTMLAKQNIYIAGALSKELTHVTLPDPDGGGPVTFWLLPYVYPARVAQALGEEGIRDYDTAVRKLIASQELDPGSRNVLVAHQNVTANGMEARRGGSESMVGGVGQVDYSAFDAFDYVALGHIHASYPVGRPAVRYAGSPLCYHFDETRQSAKGPILVELGPKGTQPRLETLRIEPLHPMRELRGKFEEIYRAELNNPARGEYLRLVLTDMPMTPGISSMFQDLYDRRGSILMERVSEYRRFSGLQDVDSERALRDRPLEELFSDYYAQRFGGESPERLERELLEFIGEQVRNADEGVWPGQAEIDSVVAFAAGQKEDAP